MQSSENISENVHIENDNCHVSKNSHIDDMLNISDNLPIKDKNTWECQASLSNVSENESGRSSVERIKNNKKKKSYDVTMFELQIAKRKLTISEHL